MKKAVLLVEGNDDLHVVKALCGAYKIPAIDEIVDSKGVENLLKSIPIRLKQSEITALGILLDADADLAGRWRETVAFLDAANYSFNDRQPSKSGLILEAPSGTILPRVGVWLMPDNQISGNLEDFLRNLIPEDDAVLKEYLNRVIDELPRPRKFPEPRLSKARIHTWLAWQEEPGKPLGQALTARYLSPQGPAAADFVRWLQDLFS